MLQEIGCKVTEDRIKTRHLFHYKDVFVAMTSCHTDSVYSLVYITVPLIAATVSVCPPLLECP